MRHFSSLLVFMLLLVFGRSQRTRNFESSFSPGGSSLAGCNGGCDGTVENRELQQLIEVNGTLYVGATNAILQLTSDLSLSSHFCNGPGNDSNTCFAPLFCEKFGETCGANVTCQNNYNTLLLPYRDRLLACGTLYESCDLLMLFNVASVYGSARDLKCKDNTNQQYVGLSSRNRSYPVVAAIYVNQTHTDSDLFFLGRSLLPFVTLLAPSSTNSYFSLIDDTDIYLNHQNVANRKPVAHLAWTTDEYAYILWSNATNPVITLSRYCITVLSEQTRSVTEYIGSNIEKGARSYTEIPLRCNVNGLSGTNLISAKVAFNKLFILFQSNNTVAMCTSSVSDLNDEFNFIRRQCWNSIDGRSHVRFLREGHIEFCISLATAYENFWSTCAFSELVKPFLSPIAGIVPVILTNEMTLNLPNDEMSSGFTIGMANELVTAFIGTSSGNILKVRLNSSLPDKISEVINSGSEREYPILNSLVISEDGEWLYTITKRSVYKASVANCSQYESCNECIESKDNYCGWCIYESSCTRSNDCIDSNDDDKWIRPTLMSDQCPRVSQTQPSIISQNTRLQKLELTLAGVQLYPDLDYTCHFSVDGSDIEFQSSPLRNFTNNTDVPSFCDFAFNSANIISQNRDHQKVTIDVVHNNNAVASAVIRVFSCAQVMELNNYTMCSSCASSEWGCSWCLASATCDINPTCSSDVISSNTSCPILSKFINLNSSIPVGIDRTFQILAERLPKPYNVYRCQIQTCGTTIVGVGLYVNETMVECSIAAEMLICPFGTSELFVYLERGDDYIIDIPMLPSVQTTLFNCSAISTKTCENCTAFQLNFGECGWCGDSCVVESQCTSVFVTDIRGCKNCDCDCDRHGAIDNDCDLSTRQCTCKPNVFGRRCDMCEDDHYGLESDNGCLPCNCNPEGSTNTSCHAKTGQCSCIEDTLGRRCDECPPFNSGTFPNCRECDCNGFSLSCDAQTGECSNCEGGRIGDTCESCPSSHYIDAETGFCIPCPCNGNIDLNDPDSCDAFSGRCEKCLYRTTGDHCEECHDGYYGDALIRSCIPCGCDRFRTNQASCTDYVCVCDKGNGQCPCIENATGRTCSGCVPGTWKTDAGCEDCDCYRAGTQAGTTCSEDTGTCECKEGYRGRTCSECDDGYETNLLECTKIVATTTTPPTTTTPTTTPPTTTTPTTTTTTTTTTTSTTTTGSPPVFDSTTQKTSLPVNPKWSPCVTCARVWWPSYCQGWYCRRRWPYHQFFPSSQRCYSWNWNCRTNVENTWNQYGYQQQNRRYRYTNSRRPSYYRGYNHHYRSQPVRYSLYRN